MTRPITSPQCAWCHQGDTAARLQKVDEPEDVNPNDKDACMCVVCGKWSVWDAKAGRLRKPTSEEAHAIADSPTAIELKLKWLMWVLGKRNPEARKARRLPERVLFDIRKQAMVRVDEVACQACQLVGHPVEVLQILLGCMLSLLTSAAITYGSQDMVMSGEDAVAKTLELLATASADVASATECALATLRAKPDEAGETTGWPR